MAPVVEAVGTPEVVIVLTLVVELLQRRGPVAGCKVRVPAVHAASPTVKYRIARRAAAGAVEDRTWRGWKAQTVCIE